MKMDRKRKRTTQRSFAWLKPKITLSTSDYSSGSCISNSSSESSILWQHNGLSNYSDQEGLSDIDTEPEDETGSRSEINTRRTLTLRHRNITVVIPEDNLSGYDRDAFYLDFIEDPGFLPWDWDSRTIHASPIISVGPHGTAFYSDKPAIIYLPLNIEMFHDDRLLCLCSNTPKDIPPLWKELPCAAYTLKNNRVIIQAQHFSLFTLVIQRPFPEFHRTINATTGGTLRIPEVCGLEVDFPPGALIHDLRAFVRVLYDWEPSQTPQLYSSLALASPVIMVGPHGCSFSQSHHDTPPVIVRLPLPHYREILSLFPEARLSLWQSSTSEDQPLVWEPINVPISIQQSLSGICVVSFSVDHFSFFKALWDVLSASLYEAKLGVAYFYPFISFSMMCQASMEENKDTQRFGLEIVCFRSDNRLPVATNYKHKVGSSLKPKLVRPGCIIVRLKSELFEADVEAGEDLALTKLEPDFRGREFEKQFACRFKQNKPLVERGTFGKVLVESQGKGTRPNEPLFEFNLNKTGLETEVRQTESTDRWSVVAITELAGTLQITEESNWKKFAQYIGFTKLEIKTKLNYSPDPFLVMVNLYQARGGTPEEFVQALYAVSRQLRLQANDGSQASTSGSPPQGSSRSRWPSFSLTTPSRWREQQSDTDTASASTSSRKRSNPTNSGGSSGSKAGAKAKRRRRFSDVSETMSSSEESSMCDQSNNKKLNDNHMWRISEFMNTQNWRALGRTLGLEESILLNIEHAYKATGFRECAYQMLLEWKGRSPAACTFATLHKALSKENMNSVAKQLASMKLDS